ncbi:MAG: 50S ribosomal protein L9 [Anaerolineaceae bacterium]|nr:50S ribosomal protein L9 [Anaerolineaceae bacterium]
MKVLLIKDVYKLGRAGEVKKVAAGYGRNYLIPQGYAIPATPGAMKQADRIMVKATERRAVLNEELGSVAEVLNGKTLTFAVKAGETGRLYGSVSDEDIVEAIAANFEIEVEKRQVETEPIRQLGTYKVPVHLTMDLIPEIEVIIHREGEAPGKEEAEPEAKKAETPAVETAPEVVEEAVEVVEEAEVEAEVEPEAPEVEEDAEAEA